VLTKELIFDPRVIISFGGFFSFRNLAVKELFNDYGENRCGTYKYNLLGEKDWKSQFLSSEKIAMVNL